MNSCRSRLLNPRTPWFSLKLSRKRNVRWNGGTWPYLKESLRNTDAIEHLRGTCWQKCSNWSFYRSTRVKERQLNAVYWEYINWQYCIWWCKSKDSTSNQKKQRKRYGYIQGWTQARWHKFWIMKSIKMWLWGSAHHFTSESCCTYQLQVQNTSLRIA